MTAKRNKASYHRAENKRAARGVKLGQSLEERAGEMATQGKDWGKEVRLERAETTKIAPLRRTLGIESRSGLGSRRRKTRGEEGQGGRRTKRERWGEKTRGEKGRPKVDQIRASYGTKIHWEIWRNRAS